MDLFVDDDMYTKKGSLEYPTIAKLVDTPSDYDRQTLMTMTASAVGPTQQLLVCAAYHAIKRYPNKEFWTKELRYGKSRSWPDHLLIMIEAAADDKLTPDVAYQALLKTEWEDFFIHKDPDEKIIKTPNKEWWLASFASL